MSVRFEVGGIQEVKALLDELKRAAKHPGPAMDLVGQRMLAMQKRHFIKEEGPDGEDWAPLKAETIARRRADKKRASETMKGAMTKGGRVGMGAARAIVHFGGAVPVAGIKGVNILRDTGGMFKSLVYTVQIDGMGAEAGISHLTKDYAPTHQYGDASRNIPARPFIYINQKEAKQLLKLFEREILKMLPGA